MSTLDKIQPKYKLQHEVKTNKLMQTKIIFEKQERKSKD